MDDLTNVQFFQFISSRLLYPEECKKNKKQGVVKVEFVVMENGSVDRVKIVSGIDCISIDKEIERVIMLSPIWTPGKKDGINVNVKLNIPIKFKLH
jgi:TonB family protein